MLEEATKEKLQGGNNTDNFKELRKCEANKKRIPSFLKDIGEGKNSPSLFRIV